MTKQQEGHDFIKACSDEISATVNLIIGKYAIQYHIDMDYLTANYRKTIAMVFALYMAEHYGESSKVVLEDLFLEVTDYANSFKPDYNTAPSDSTKKLE